MWRTRTPGRQVRWPHGKLIGVVTGEQGDVVPAGARDTALPDDQLQGTTWLQQCLTLSSRPSGRLGAPRFSPITTVHSPASQQQSPLVFPHCGVLAEALAG